MQYQLALHGVHCGANWEFDGTQVAWALGGRFTKFSREARAGDQIFFTHDRGTLQDVAQFANVAGPGVTHKDVDNFRADAFHVLAVLDVYISQDVIGE